MQVFITGGSGFIGSSVVRELIGHGHKVAALARSDASAQKLTKAGATVVRGDLTDLDVLRSSAETADAALHLGYVHDFSDMAKIARIDLQAAGALIDGIAASRGPKVMISTTGIGTMTQGVLAREDAPPDPNSPGGHRGETDRLVLAAAKKGVRSIIFRLPPSVHGDGDHGFIPILMDIARKAGVSAYLGDGNNVWPAVHRDDAAVLYRLTLERAADGTIPPGSAIHAIGDAGVPFRDIAQTLADKLKLGKAVSRPPEHFGWFGRFASIDNPASAEITQRWTGWKSTRPGLLADIASDAYPSS